MGIEGIRLVYGQPALWRSGLGNHHGTWQRRYEEGEEKVWHILLLYLPLG